MPTTLSSAGFTNKVTEVQELVSLYLDGYGAGLVTDTSRLRGQIQDMPITERRVLYEGACSALSSKFLQGACSWESVENLLSEISEYSDAIAGLGLGEALSQRSLMPKALTNPEDCYSTWMMLDGYGFNEGMYQSQRAIIQQSKPEGLLAIGEHAYYQGLGRSFWFVAGADPKQIVSLINYFPTQHHSDLWFGIGLMTGYWGVLDERDLRRLRKLAHKRSAALKAGVALSAVLRAQAGQIRDFTDGACRIICEAPATEVGALAVEPLQMQEPQPMTGRSFYRWQLAIAQIMSN